MGWEPIYSRMDACTNENGGLQQRALRLAIQRGTLSSMQNRSKVTGPSVEACTLKGGHNNRNRNYVALPWKRLRTELPVSLYVPADQLFQHARTLFDMSPVMISASVIKVFLFSSQAIFLTVIM